MRFTLITLFTTLLAASVTMATPASGTEKSVIISYPNDTPDSVVEQAKEEIRKKHGKITHEYNIIKGFAAIVPNDDIVATVKTMNSKYAATVEEDQVMHTYGGGKKE